MEPIFVLPGDQINPSDLIPHNAKHPLRIGPGLRPLPPNGLAPTLCGQLVPDRNKNAIRVEPSRGRYIPRQGELVIGTVQRSAADVYYVSLSSHTAPCLLPQLAFEGATKKTRPILAPGSLVYARVAMTNKHMDPELECVSAATGKADGLGPLTGGMVFEVSLAMVRALLLPRRSLGKLVVLDALVEAGLKFEMAAGWNGRVWVDGDSARGVITVGRALQETDRGGLDAEGQKKLVKRLIKEMSG